MAYPLNNDMEFEERTVKEVTVFDNQIQFTCTDNVGTAFDKKLVPKALGQVSVGDRTRFYGQFGRPIRGLFISGYEIWYRTPEEDEAYQEEQRLEATRKRLREYEEKKDEYAARVAKLPQPFRARIERFRRANLNFGQDYEGYELFCCEQAAMIAAEITDGSLKNPERDAAGILNDFNAMSWEQQIEKVPDLSKEHSGNTFGKSCELARIYIEAPARLPHAHGALCALVGCSDYGCFAMEISTDE